MLDDLTVFFDKALYGALLRTERHRSGFNRAEDFCAAVNEQTGLKINKEKLYRIEKGIQAPTLEQFLAFCFVLYDGRISFSAVLEQWMNSATSQNMHRKVLMRKQEYKNARIRAGEYLAAACS